MLNGSLNTPPRQSDTSRIALIAGLGIGAFALGIVITLGVVQLNAQKQQIAQMNQMFSQLAQQQDADQDVTRTVGSDLLTVQQPAMAGDMPVTHASAPSSDNAIKESAALDREETVARIDAGVQQLVTAVVNGQYKIHTEFKDINFKGRIHYTFLGYEAEQAALEKLIVQAANRGFIEYTDAVVCSQGLVNGDILLFTMVERALEQGTVEQRLAGLRMLSEARALLEKSDIEPQVVAQVPVAAPAAPLNTADKIRSLVNAAVAPQDSTSNLDAATLANARKFETLAIIQAGVQELVTAVVKGNYDIHTDYEDEHFSGRIHFAFVGHEEDQTELERLLANAAEAGIVKHSEAVVDGDGRVNGHILLFDLVERALENGTLEEQRAGAEMKRKAQEMLAGNEVVGRQPANAQGERFYIVEPGDNLAYIALQFYGNTNDYTRIYEANRTQISQPNDIRVGQRLRIPNA